MRIGSQITNPGELRTTIELDTPTVSSDSGGFQTKSWTKAADVWAKWENVHGYEVWSAQAVNAVAPATVLIRYYSGLNTTWSVVKDGVRYEIVSVDDVGDRHEYMELKVQQVKGA